MEKRKTTPVSIPKFASEQEEATWWASVKGRKFLSGQAAQRAQNPSGGSKLVAKLGKANSGQITLRLPASDLARASEICRAKGNRLPDTAKDDHS